MRPYRLTDTCALQHHNGDAVVDPGGGLIRVDADQIDVPHLGPHVERWTLPKGDSVGVLISYSCHCWTSALDPAHPPGLMQIMDGPRPRVIDPARFEASQTLPDLIRALDEHRIYVTSSERNYAVYNMTFTAEDGLSYTAFFTVRPRKGKFNGTRHHLVLFVESAYHIVQPQKGTKTKLPAILAQGLMGKMIRPRR